MTGYRFDGRTTMYWPDGILDDHVGLRIAAIDARLEEAWATFLGRLPWRYFATLTFSPRKVAKVSKQLADKEVQAWVSLLERMMRSPLGWLYSLERDVSGRWHSHVLV